MAEKMQFDLELDSSGFLSGIAAASTAAVGLSTTIMSGMVSAGATTAATASMVTQQTVKLSQGFVATVGAVKELQAPMARTAAVTTGFAQSITRTQNAAKVLAERATLVRDLWVSGMRDMKVDGSKVFAVLGNVAKKIVPKKVREALSKTASLLRSNMLTRGFKVGMKLSLIHI